MEIKLYNTLTRAKDVFKPIETGRVGMYHCGPTVYDAPHIGNLKAYVFADSLRRMFEYVGYEVKQVINVTDIGHLSGDSDEGEDKMTKALRREDKPMTLDAMREIGDKYFNAFVDDLKKLNIEMAHKFPRASDHIKEDIEIIDILDKKGIAYVISNGVCFDTAKFKSYGKLGNIKVESLKEGARVSIDSEKKSPIDFWLWKFDRNIGWDSPWGKGFPGWHIECSAMSRKYLGQPFDIHTGGIDHIPVHHNNEIAQSEAAYDTPLANYWMHNEFLVIDSGKMGKSEGNAITLKTLTDHSIEPIAYRYWLLTAHYRVPVNFSFEAVAAAQNALFRLISTLSGLPDGGNIDENYKAKFEAYISDDLDMPKALALVWDLLKDSSVSEADKKATILDFDRVFGLNLKTAIDASAHISATAKKNIPPPVLSLAEDREKARQAKDWQKADLLRNEIENKGFKVKDTDNGFELSALE